MADAFAAPNEGSQPTDAGPDAGAGSDQANAPLSPPDGLFRHTEMPSDTALPDSAESPRPAEPSQGHPDPEASPVEPAAAPSGVEAGGVEASTAPAEQPEPAAAATAAAPEPPASAPAPATAAPEVASTIEVPPLEPGDGGEWELLVAKVQQWLASGQLRELVAAARTPLTLLAYLVVAVLVLQIYAALLNVLEGLPLVPGLLELVGVITVVRFALTRLVRSSDRQQVIASLKSRWKAFRGQG